MKSNRCHTTALAAAFVATALFGAWAQAAENYTFDPSHTAVVWHANHFGFSNPSGKFTGVEGTLVLDEQNPAASKVDIRIDIASLSTGLGKFDEHLKSPDFLDVAQFPFATFKSTDVTLVSDTQAKVAGNFTLHGVTKPVILDVTLNKLGTNPINNKKTAGFSATTTLQRADYGIDMYVPAVSNDIKIAIEAEATLQ